MDQSLIYFYLNFPDVLNRMPSVLPLYYPKHSYIFLVNATIYLTFQNIHYLLTTQVFVRFLDYIIRNAAVSFFTIT